MSGITTYERFFYVGDTSYIDITINYGTILFLLYQGSALGDVVWSFQGLLAGFMLQASIWVVEPTCYGVSLVWCYMVGRLIITIVKKKKKGKADRISSRQHAMTLAVPSLSLFFYVYSEPPITTVAHTVGVGLGLVMGLRFAERNRKSIVADDKEHSHCGKADHHQHGHSHS